MLKSFIKTEGLFNIFDIFCDSFISFSPSEISLLFISAGLTLVFFNMLTIFCVFLIFFESISTVFLSNKLYFIEYFNSL